MPDEGRIQGVEFPPLSAAPKEQIAALASLYDRFAQALDPFSPERDEAERVFMQDVAQWYDSLRAKALASRLQESRDPPVPEASCSHR